MSINKNIMVIFQFMTNLEQSSRFISNACLIMLGFALITILNQIKTGNTTKKSLKVLAHRKVLLEDAL